MVNSVAPGWVDTGHVKPALDDPSSAKKFGAPFHGRVGKPEEIAGPVLFLCTEYASFITGEVFNVNGGAVLRVSRLGLFGRSATLMVFSASKQKCESPPHGRNSPQAATILFGLHYRSAE